MKQSVIYKPQRDYAARQREAGLVSITVWVPEKDREKAIKYAGKLRKDHEKDI